MWSGRFREPLDRDFENWQRSFPFDWRLLPQESAASRAHASALTTAGILTAEEFRQISSALDEIQAAHAAGIDASLYPQVEDIHHFVELELTARLGALGQKLHTGRSRNEQIATDLRLYVREQSGEIALELSAWARALIETARKAGSAPMPAYTHLQRAEPVLVGHWLGAYVEMLLRDLSRLRDLVARLNYCPLGSGAVAGATLPLDRTIASRELGFLAPTANSIDATSDRDFALEFLQTLTGIVLHASRFAEEITLFATAEYGFVELPERFSTGSSAMPQKKNPDLLELVRGKAGRIVSASHWLEINLKALPLAYNKDLQETQEPLFAAAGEVKPMLRLLARFTAALTFRQARMQAACENGYLNAMAAATYLVHKGVPFRQAHEQIGQAVRYGLENGLELQALSIEQIQKFAPGAEADFFAAITLEATVDCHDVIGGTATSRVREALQGQEERLRILAEAWKAAGSTDGADTDEQSATATKEHCAEDGNHHS